MEYMATTNDVTIGSVIKLDNILWLVVGYKIDKPGKGGEVVRTKLKNILTQEVYDKTFNSGVKVEIINLQDFLNDDGSQNSETFKVPSRTLNKKIIQKPKPVTKKNESDNFYLMAKPKAKPTAKKIKSKSNNLITENIDYLVAIANTCIFNETNGYRSFLIFALKGVEKKNENTYKRENSEWILVDFYKDPNAFEFKNEKLWQGGHEHLVPKQFVEAWDLSQKMDKPLYDNIVRAYQQGNSEEILGIIGEGSLGQKNYFSDNEFYRRPLNDSDLAQALQPSDFTPEELYKIDRAQDSDSVEFLRQLAKDENEFVRSLVAENFFTPKESLRELAKDSCTVRISVARNWETPLESLNELAKDTNEHVRRNVAENPSTPSAALAKLAKDTDVHVRRNVAENPSTPSAALAELAKDSDAEVVSSATYNIS